MRPRLAVALDGPSLEAFEPLLDELAGLPVLVKVGVSLFTAVGPSVVHHLRLAGFETFLDLKLHDIPHQVGLAVAAVARLDVALLTVHAAGGRAMLETALSAARGSRLQLAGVTVLTSMDRDDLRATGIDGELPAVVRQRLALCRDVGLHGAVLSAAELAEARDVPADFLRVVPAVRLATSVADDQKRTATVAEAVAAGAGLLVVGRPVVTSEQPRQVVQQLLAMIGGDHG
jgi:orotidine-5'-phosphate decarboxylase